MQGGRCFRAAAVLQLREKSGICVVTSDLYYRSSDLIKKPQWLNGVLELDRREISKLEMSKKIRPWFVLWQLKLWFGFGGVPSRLETRDSESSDDCESTADVISW